MKNLMARKTVALVSKLLVAAAVLFVSMASLWMYHRPQTPAELSVKK